MPYFSVCEEMLKIFLHWIVTQATQQCPAGARFFFKFLNLFLFIYFVQPFITGLKFAPELILIRENDFISSWARRTAGWCSFSLLFFFNEHLNSYRNKRSAHLHIRCIFTHCRKSTFKALMKLKLPTSSATTKLYFCLLTFTVVVQRGHGNFGLLMIYLICSFSRVGLLYSVHL